MAYRRANGFHSSNLNAWRAMAGIRCYHIMDPKGGRAAMSAADRIAAGAALPSGLALRVDRAFGLALEIGTALLVVAEIVILLIGIVARYVFNRPLIWSDACLAAVPVARDARHGAGAAAWRADADDRAGCGSAIDTAAHARLRFFAAIGTWMAGLRRHDDGGAGRLAVGIRGRLQEGGPVASAGSRGDEAGGPGSAVLAWSLKVKATDRWIRSWRAPA